VITATKLRSRTVKELAALARKKKISGWHSMRKEELIRALVNRQRAETRRKRAADKSKGATSASANGSNRQRARKEPSTKQQRRLDRIKARLSELKDLAIRPVEEGNGRRRDRLVVMVRGPYWLHAYWELTRRSVERAKAAMGQHWHASRPVLRLLEVVRNGTTSAARRTLRDITIHGGVNNWYIDVHDPPKSFQLEIGYLAGEKFFCIARSNIVSTPSPGAGDAFDQNWAEVAKEYERIYAMSGGYNEQEGSSELKEVLEEHLQRPVGEPSSSRFGPGAAGGSARERPFDFHIDTELIVHGRTEPDAHVTLRGEPVPLRPDGSFAVRFNLPDRRHVLPVVARSPDGAEQHTIVLAVDRNTKVMEPIIRDPGQ